MKSTEQIKAMVNEELDRGGEWVFQRTPISLVVEYFVLGILAFGAFKLTAAYPDMTQRVDLLVPMNISLPILVPIIFAGYIVHRLKDSLYSIRSEQVRATHGRLSLSKQDTEIDMLDVRAVEIRRSILGRIFNFGNVEVGTAAHHGEEILMRGVADPSSVRDVILHRKELAIQRNHSEGKLVANYSDE